MSSWRSGEGRVRLPGEVEHRDVVGPHAQAEAHAVRHLGDVVKAVYFHWRQRFEYRRRSPRQPRRIFSRSNMDSGVAERDLHQAPTLVDAGAGGHVPQRIAEMSNHEQPFQRAIGQERADQRQDGDGDERTQRPGRFLGGLAHLLHHLLDPLGGL